MVVIRPAIEADVEAIAAIATASFWSVCEQLEPGSHDHPGYRKLMVAEDRKEAAEFWKSTTIAEVHGKAVGVCILKFDENLLSGLWILPENQGQGVGALLIDDAIASFKARGATFVHLDVHTMNPAKRLYERAGFEVTEETTRHSTGLGRDIPHFIMKKAI